MMLLSYLVNPQSSVKLQNLVQMIFKVGGKYPLNRIVQILKNWTLKSSNLITLFNISLMPTKKFSIRVHQ